MNGYTVGIDIGTTGTKTVLLDVETGIVATATRETALHSPAPGFAEADTDQWYRNVVESIREVLATSGAPADQVGAIATSGMVPAVLPVDGAGRPLRRAILQNDARAHREVTDLAAALTGTDLVHLTGSALTQQSVAPTTVWLRDNEPDVYAGTAHWLGSYDWVLCALGAAGARRTELGTGVGSVHHRRRDRRHRAARRRTRSRDAATRSPSGHPGRRTQPRRRRRHRSAGGHRTGGRRRRPRALGLRRGRQRSRRRARQTRWGGRHPGRQRHPGRRRAALPRRAPGARPLATQRLHGHQREPDPLVPDPRRAARP